MNPIDQRTYRLIGEDGIQNLKNARVLLFGVGGVGSYAAESLVRAGIGSLTIVDGDTVDPSNLNRQLIALESNIGEDKVKAAAARYRDIRADVEIIPIKRFVTDDVKTWFHMADYDFVLDAVDTVTAKINIISACAEAGVPVISSMGTGGKLDPERLRISPIEKTSVCPLARVMRRELKARGIRKVPVVWSDEKPIGESRPPGSLSFVPGSAGLLMASYVVRALMRSEESGIKSCAEISEMTEKS